MTIVAAFRRLQSSLANSAGTVVFGMEDGTVSIFGLIFGVAATTTSSATVLIAGASGAVAAAVSMMAGAYLDVETTRDAINARRSSVQSDRELDAFSASLPNRFKAAGLTREQSTALSGAVQGDRAALGGLMLALQSQADEPLNPWEQALWMLLADFLAAAVPILPFVFAPIPQARVISGVVTMALLIGLGIGRARIAERDILRTVLETACIGIAAALAGVLIGVLIDRNFTG
ncbi:MAG: VIT1/CCC1 transporter family protein [Hyphomicrobiales bacterium]|nr:VIT1/CCC1 transporter family protein [Hyphomicrobiales bacterium]MDE2284171.1 VIT1/CCC1 transporter family protein [Hyphomicrobiales bacterium]